MASYAFRCGSCLDQMDFEFDQGTAPRLIRCETAACGGTMQLLIGHGVQIAPSALENKGAAVREIRTKDEALDADMPAYKRMRRRGLQPKQIDGARHLENEVGDNFDIEHKARLEKVKAKHAISESWSSTRERAREAIQAAQESGWSPVG